MRALKNFIRKAASRAAGVHNVEQSIAVLEQRLNQVPLQASFDQQLANVRHDLLLPKYLFTSPLDYHLETFPPGYDPAILIPGEPMPVPSAQVRPGYYPDDDTKYLASGKADHDLILEVIQKHLGLKPDLAILDWGCSSGRVLRHFWSEHQSLGWKLQGTDVQDYLVEWIRQNFPQEIEVLSASTFPHLPYKDSSLDIIYGISVFTHTKYLWDAWLSEFRRVLKPGGLVIQTVQCEYAWEWYNKNTHKDWVRNGHPQSMLQEPKMNKDYFLYGDPFISQTFFKEEVIKRYWGRIMSVIDFLPPKGDDNFQNWIVLRS